MYAKRKTKRNKTKRETVKKQPRRHHFFLLHSPLLLFVSELLTETSNRGLRAIPSRRHTIPNKRRRSNTAVSFLHNANIVVHEKVLHDILTQILLRNWWLLEMEHKRQNAAVEVAMALARGPSRGRPLNYLVKARHLL